MKTVYVYTDGACIGNPGPGGWAAILKYNDFEKEISGGEKHTTNNRMELMAAIKALEALKEPCYVIVTSDSQYLVHAFTHNWIQNWLKTDFKHGKVKNIDLWKRLLELTEKHDVVWEWVKGHNGHEMNERCDMLANKQSFRYRHKK